MKAVAIQAFGSPEGLAVFDFPDPSPAAGQVLIATEKHAYVQVADDVERRISDGEITVKLPANVSWPSRTALRIRPSAVPWRY